MTNWVVSLSFKNWDGGKSGSVSSQELTWSPGVLHQTLRSYGYGYLSPSLPIVNTVSFFLFL